jgi:hypothetical protein
MSDFIFWRCSSCGNVVATERRAGRPEKCYVCRTGDSGLTDAPLYEEIDGDDL